MGPTLEELRLDADRINDRFSVFPHCPDTLKVWATRGMCLPSILVDAILAGLPEKGYIEVCCHGDGTGSFGFRLTDQETKIAVATRSFDIEKHVVDHLGFQVFPQYRAKGVAKVFLRNSFEVYRRVGITLVKISASLEAGGYTWARFGFQPLENDWMRVKGELRARMGSLAGLSVEASEALQHALADESTAAIWPVADLDETVDGAKLGRVLLSGTEWKGFLRLDDRDAMDRFNAYVAQEDRSVE